MNKHALIYFFFLYFCEETIKHLNPMLDLIVNDRVPRHTFDKAP